MVGENEKVTRLRHERGAFLKMKELTEEQIKRQDSVDNAIYQLIREINPADKEIEWDIEMIGEIRDVVRDWMVERLKLTDEQNFYPYLEE